MSESTPTAPTAPTASPTPAPVRQVRFTRPPGATSVLLVRHGESIPFREDEPFPLVGGHGDPRLDPRGVAQAERIAERLSHPYSGETVEAIYVTNLRRTAETAAPLASRLGLEPMVEADLREVFLGDWEGGTYRTKIQQGDPIVQRMFAEERWDVIPGGEPDDQFSARVKAGIDRIGAKHPDQMVAVFTHGGVIGRVLATATGSRPFALTGAANASISHLFVVGDSWSVRSYNDTGHLEGLDD